MNLTEAKEILLKNGENPNFPGSFPEKYLWACKEGNMIINIKDEQASLLGDFGIY
jgi:hypothetical protein